MAEIFVSSFFPSLFSIRLCPWFSFLVGCWKICILGFWGARVQLELVMILDILSSFPILNPTLDYCLIVCYDWNTKLVELGAKNGRLCLSCPNGFWELVNCFNGRRMKPNKNSNWWFGFSTFIKFHRNTQSIFLEIVWRLGCYSWSLNPVGGRTQKHPIENAIGFFSSPKITALAVQRTNGRMNPAIFFSGGLDTSLSWFPRQWGIFCW